MLIVNGYGFQGNIATDPQMLHGSLDPSEQYSDPLLLSAAVGSIYISKWIKTDNNCQITDAGACMWLKVKKGTSCCNGLGSPKDWVRCCCFKLLEGTTVPNGTTDPWCKAQRGDYYLQQSEECGTQLWLKIRDGCSVSDWLNLNDKSSCVVTGSGAPNAAALCDQPKGAFYVDTADSCRVYVKLFDNCGAAGAGCADWLPLSLTLTQNQDLTATTNRRITLDAAAQTLNVPKAIYARRQINNGTQVIPANVLTELTGLTQIVADSPAPTSVMCPVGAPDSDIVLPVSGFYNVLANVTTNTNTDTLRIQVMMNDTFTLGRSDTAGNSALAGKVTQYSIDLSPRQVGQQISIYAMTTNPAGETVTHANLSVIFVE